MATIEQVPSDERSMDEKVIGWLSKKWWNLVIYLFAFIVLMSSWGIVPAGHRGVLLTFGAVSQKMFGEGLYWKIPIIQSVQKIDVRINKDSVDAAAASKDLQVVSSHIALNYHLDPDHVRNIYQQVGMEYKSRIIDPAVQEATKAVASKFTAEELITKREVVRDDVKTLIREKLAPYGILIDDYNIVNFDFSKTFNDAIEAKVTTEQAALAAKNKLKQVEYEAQQKIAEAQGKAKALQIEGTAVAQNPAVIQIRMIEAWKEGGSKVPEVIVSSGGGNFLYNLLRKDK